LVAAVPEFCVVLGCAPAPAFVEGVWPEVAAFDPEGGVVAFDVVPGAGGGVDVVAEPDGEVWLVEDDAPVLPEEFGGGVVGCSLCGVVDPPVWEVLVF